MLITEASFLLRGLHYKAPTQHLIVMIIPTFVVDQVSHRGARYISIQQHQAWKTDSNDKISGILRGHLSRQTSLVPFFVDQLLTMFCHKTTKYLSVPSWSAHLQL